MTDKQGALSKDSLKIVINQTNENLFRVSQEIESTSKHCAYFGFKLHEMYGEQQKLNTILNELKAELMNEAENGT